MNLAISYAALGREEQALFMQRDVYSGTLKQYGEEHEDSLISALNLSTALVDTGNYAEARAFMPDQVALTKRVLGSDHIITLDFQGGWARAFFCDEDVPAEQLAEPAAALEKALKIAQRVLGPEHPSTGIYRGELAFARQQIALRQGA